MLMSWIRAFRLQTLPLALGAIILGSSIQKLSFRFDVFVLAATTALLLQILSNLANDYGDFMKGTDQHRKDRQLAGGKISPKAMKVAIIFFILLSLFSGILLLYRVFRTDIYWWLIFFSIGILCILAALAYTIGKKAYGYYALGDLAVFIFFGLVGVLGTAFLYKQVLYSYQFLPAIAYGCLCVAVLNVNNIRDIDKDILNHKITLAAQLGHQNALNYQVVLLLSAIVCLLAYHFTDNYLSLSPVGLALMAYFHIRRLSIAATEADYNTQLRFLSLGSLIVAILFMLRLYY